MRKLLLVTVVALVTGLVAAGCGQGGGGSESAEQNKTLTLGYIEWDENVAVSNLTKVLLEEKLGYEKVELKLLDLGPVFQGVASGDLDAFQDVWMPNHKDKIAAVEDDIEHLDPWYEGETKFGIGVPAYMDVQSLADLNQVEGTNKIHGIEPGAAIHPTITDEVIPAYDLKGWELVESSTPAMLAGLEKAYENEEPYVFLPWSPHWMNAEFDIVYLEDPKDAQGDFNDPAKISSIVNKDLSEDDPVAYEFIKAILLDEEQLNALEADIQEQGADDPVKGVEKWLEENGDVVQPWIDAAKEAQSS